MREDGKRGKRGAGAGRERGVKQNGGDERGRRGGYERGAYLGRWGKRRANGSEGKYEGKAQGQVDRGDTRQMATEDERGRRD